MKKEMMAAQDNAAPPASDPDNEVFETMVSGLRENLFGDALADVQKQLGASQDLPRDIGALVTTMTVEASQQAGDNGIELSMDIVFGVATEMIDDLLDIAVAMGLIEEATDDLRRNSLMSCIEAYGSMASTSPEDKQAAMAQLKELQASGDLEEGTKYIAEVGAKEGIDPFADGGQGSPAAVEPAPPEAGQPPQLMG